MALAPGTRLGSYEIIAALGAGGMGEVYRARDSKLNRNVAIKVLLPAVANDPDRLARFSREAQVLASLNHPNIATIFGLEESDGVRALVLELVEGPTLADRIAQGAIPQEETLPIAKQIAEALEAARLQGVIHRDLKPANIKLRPDGVVKVLDFGLAKLTQRSDSGTQAPNLSQSPTITHLAATSVGVIMGTASYMSPEQARGKPVDKQTDIWAFGCVLYEMLSGRPAFAGETTSDTIARIIEREPDWRELPASVSKDLRDLLRRCLQKDQQHRLRDIADARHAIEDIHTTLRRRRRVFGLPILAAETALALAILAGAWWYSWRSIPAVQHDQVSLLIADFENRTNDPAFDRTLEPLLRIVFEGAGFISAYDRTGVRALGGTAVERLDERAALEIAVKQGVGVVISGSVDREGSGYGISIKATQALTGNVIASATNRASNKEQVLAAATKLASTARKALGDETSTSAQMFAMASVSAASLEVARHYAAGREASSNGKFDEARRSFAKAVELDPKFGIGYQALAGVSMNLGKLQDADKYIREALRYLDGMTERERYTTRGLFYTMTGDDQHCVKEYSDMIARYAADVQAHNNLALCSTHLRNMPRALDEMRRAVAIVPRRALYRFNLALYADYAGDFQAGEREARTVRELGNPQWSLFSLALAQLGQEQLLQAASTYQELGNIDALSASQAAAGLGDLATYEGHFSDAVRVLKQGAAADLMTSSPDRAAAKFASLAYVQFLQGRKEAAVGAAEKALANSKTVATRFLAARSMVEAGEIARAQTVTASLASELQAGPRAHAKILEGLVFLKRGDARQAIKLLNDANGLLDTWIGHFELGRAYLEAGQLPQADSEFDRCIKRRGEALALFLDEEPTYGYVPSVYYYQGRVREGLNSAGFAESYRTYLRIREKAGEDPLLPEVRRGVSR